MLHHKKRRRTRKTAVLQKKEELLESDVSSFDDELLVEINSTEIKNSLSYKSQLHCSESNPGAEMSQETLKQTWSRRWKWSLGHSLWQAVSPLRRSTKSLLTLGLLIAFIFSCTVEVQGQPPPPPAGFLDFDNLPVTRFSCEGKVIGGYYADVETGCQMFHVCTLGQKDEVQDIKFLCLNGTVFDQETRVCERVDEVDCSKAEQFFDLNLDLYAPHVATPKPPEQDLEEEDANISPVSTSKPTSPSTTTTRTTTTTKRPTTTTPKSLPSTTSSSSRTRLTTPQPPEATTTKGYSSFNYYLKTPHSHVASGYNSQSRQSYIFNHKPNIEDESEDNSGSYTVSENTARKIPSGPKTIVYTPSTSSSTSRPSNNRGPSRNSVSQTSTTTAAPSKVEELDEQYADEYYEDELPLEYDVSSSTAGSQQSSSKQSSYELEPRSSKTSSNSYSAQPQTQFRGKSSQNSYDFRDGRSTGSSKNAGSNNNGKGSKGGSESVSVAVSRSKATISPPVITRPPTTKHKVINVTTTTTTTEEPYYYDDDYPEDEVVQQQQQPAIIVRGTSSSTSRSAGQSSDNRSNSNKASSNTKSNTATSDTSGPSGPSGSGSEGDNAEYYDEGDGQSLNVNDHHFTHVDVPRIPFAKPNVPRVLVTNGKPFLPRLRRQSIHHKVSDSSSSKDTVPMVDISSLWDSLAGHEEYDDPHSHKYTQNIPLNNESSLRIRRNIPRSLSKLNLEVNRASSSVINSSKVSTDIKISGVTKR